MVYHRILLAFDGSAEGRAALAEGMALAGLCQAEVHLLSVLEISGSDAFGEGIHPVESFEGSELARLRALVDEGLNRLRTDGIKSPQGHIAFGRPVEQIAELARRVDADLIVVGHRHRGLLARWWQGSLSQRLIDQVNCSVLIALDSSNVDAESATP